jgi:RimJ/RimL family protein N-acetyltransferase
MRLPLPDPPLGDGAIRLRPWAAEDAGALAAAWADPEVQRWNAVPESRSELDAARWIAGEARRRELGLALDLVVSPADPYDDAVLGEVGLGPIAWEAGKAEASEVGKAAEASEAGQAAIGWWIAGPARGRGVAARAVTLLASWAERELDLRVVALIDPANAASLRVAERAGIRHRLIPPPSLSP